MISGDEEKSLDEPELPTLQYHNGIPVFPFVPDSVKRSTFYNIEAGELPTEADVNELMQTMWEQANASFYYFHGHDGGPSADAPILAARQLGMIEMDEMERHYFKHPNFRNDFVSIRKGVDGKFAWEWEEEVVREGPEYWRTTLRLSPRKREELDTWRKVHMEELAREEAQRKRYETDVFLSYASADSDEAEVLVAKLEVAGCRVFMAKKTLKAGDDFAEEIRRALIGSRELWVLVSPSSQGSEWVATEWGAAWALGKRIVPVLHRCAPQSLPARLQKLHCVDLYKIDDHITSMCAKTP